MTHWYLFYSECSKVLHCFENIFIPNVSSSVASNLNDHGSLTLTLGKLDTCRALTPKLPSPVNTNLY